jgi:hypothetical protein
VWEATHQVSLLALVLGVLLLYHHVNNPTQLAHWTRMRYCTPSLQGLLSKVNSNRALPVLHCTYSVRFLLCASQTSKPPQGPAALPCKVS